MSVNKSDTKSESVPIRSIGFIMDGNRRWARAQGRTTLEGHKRGGEVFVESIDWVSEAGIPHAVYYAFSTENWRRSKEEVSYLMELFAVWLKEAGKKVAEKEAAIKFIGRREDFSAKLQTLMNDLEIKSKQIKFPKTIIWIALSYGGRAEIVAAANRAIGRGEMVTEETLRKYLWSADLPDLDLIVRTGGEQRLSNFMTWHSVYSELLFLDTYWPALTKSDFDGILKAYASRERRKGK